MTESRSVFFSFEGDGEWLQRGLREFFGDGNVLYLGCGGNHENIYIG